MTDLERVQVRSDLMDEISLKFLKCSNAEDMVHEFMKINREVLMEYIEISMKEVKK